MGFIEKYDMIVAQIEDAVNQDIENIPELLSKKTGLHMRVLGDAFQFVSGMTLSQYIKQRRMIRAMHYRNEHNCSLEDVAERFGFSDAPTMSKAFKSSFGISPSQMSVEDLTKQQPLTADKLMSEDDNQKFDEIRGALDLNCVYGLSDAEAAFAYELSKKRDIPLQDAFELVESFVLQENYPMFREEFLEFTDRIRAYLEEEKVFIENPERMMDVWRAIEILDELFPDHKKRVEGDPLQMGSLTLIVEDFDICVNGRANRMLFAELCMLVDNFEIYSPCDDEIVHFAAIMVGVYTRIA